MMILDFDSILRDVHCPLFLRFDDLNENSVGQRSTKSYASAEQSELPLSIPRNSVKSDDGGTSRIYLDNAGDNMTQTLYYMMLTSRKPC